MNIITVQGEARVQLGGKVYTVMAPEGVTIREEPEIKSLGFMLGQAAMHLPYVDGRDPL